MRFTWGTILWDEYYDYKTNKTKRRMSSYDREYIALDVVYKTEELGKLHALIDYLNDVIYGGAYLAGCPGDLDEGVEVDYISFYRDCGAVKEQKKEIMEEIHEFLKNYK